jgi:hypothetical protein
MMKSTILIALVVCSVSCNSPSDPRNANAEDSVSTDSLTNPSFNPEEEADSAAKQMNLDSTNLKDSVKQY